MGTSSSIMGIYLAEKDEYITLQEAHEKELISPALYGELMERICASGFYIAERDSKLVLVNGF